MNIERAKMIACLTENNNHTQALIEIAKSYPVCGSLLNILNSIKNISEIEHCMPFNLLNYRNDIATRLFDNIEKYYGIEEAKQVYQLT